MDRVKENLEDFCQAQLVQPGQSAAHPLKGKSPHGGWTAAPPFLTGYIVWFVLSPFCRKGKRPVTQPSFLPQRSPFIWPLHNWKRGAFLDFPRSIFCETEMCMRPELQHDSTLSGLIYRKYFLKGNSCFGWCVCLIRNKATGTGTVV